MSSDRHREAEDGHERSGRRRRYRSGSHDWKTPTPASLDSSPHPREDQVHSHGRRTRRSGSPTTTLPYATNPEMPPPPPQARSSMDAYRRPDRCMSYDDRRDRVGGRRRSGRHVSSPEYARRDPAYSSAYAGGDGDDDEDDDDHIEVVEVIEEDDGSSRHRSGHHSSREDYIPSSGGRRRRRRTRHADDDDDDGETAVLNRYQSFSSPTRGSSRVIDRSESSRLGSRHQQVVDVIEDSRPPVSSSKRSTLRRRRSSDNQDRPRASSATRPSRSRSGSVSRRPSGILETLFGSSSIRRASPEEHVRTTRRLECVVCMESMSPSKAARLKCGHAMCRACLERSFKLSLTDPQHMPPRCCTQEHIPLRHVDRIFDDSFKRAWNRKFAEFSTRNRLYCPSQRCGEWIKPEAIHRENGVKVARCDRCRIKVCVSCHGKWHGNAECPQDEETARLLAQAQAEGWKRCYRCKAIVELKEGCNHMTCRCGAEFCMICGTKWKRCDCPWFSNNDDGGDLRDVPVPQIRGDLHDIFRGEGPPTPAELRSQHPVTMTLPTRPRSYHEEKLIRRLQGQRDAELARQLQYGEDAYDGHDMMGGIGDIHGIGNAAGHLMNEDYRGGGRLPVRTVPRDYGPVERRLADRLSETPRVIRMGQETVTVRAEPVAPRLRQHSLEEELYDHRRPRASRRAERVVGGRVSRRYEDEMFVHAPRRRIEEEEASSPRSSDMAGLNGYGQGMNRVSQWRSFVEPGIPDGESVDGHA
ncbi:hypothetical protein CP533_1698 [Ophiocordyceps camponoti-saundersi (nom. inval.)]|nr:hypothetical protein CP533_1698 [Ophiocordyceps camponoti-saundersi (nom. inval.)]